MRRDGRRDPATRRVDGSAAPWIDTLGHESLYDYDPVWAKCEALGVVPTFHSQGYGWGTRTSTRNYVYNHLGNFAAAQEAICRSLLIGGVPKRFPTLRFAFLEGGVSWALQLLTDVVGHYEKRNKHAVRRYDPARLNLELCEQLFSEFARDRIAQNQALLFDVLVRAQSAPRREDAEIDDFAESGIESVDDILRIFGEQFYFGCEADDPLNVVAFDRRVAPIGNVNAMFSSDIGHWDVPEMRDVVHDAWSLVTRNYMTRENFFDFAYRNVVEMLSGPNPNFFKNTVIQDDVRALLSVAEPTEKRASYVL